MTRKKVKKSEPVEIVTEVVDTEKETKPVETEFVQIKLVDEGYLLPDGTYKKKGYEMFVIPSQAEKFVLTKRWEYV
jgi:hypothetical protein